MPKGAKEWLQAAAMAGCVLLTLAVLFAGYSSSATVGPARAYAQVAAPEPEAGELLPAKPDRPPVTCAWLRKVRAGVAWQEIYGCWPASCLRDVRERIARRAVK